MARISLEIDDYIADFLQGMSRNNRGRYIAICINDMRKTPKGKILEELLIGKTKESDLPAQTKRIDNVLAEFED